MMKNTIKLIGLVDEDFINYKKASMHLAFPYCTFKCGIENCQNAECADQEIIEVDIDSLIDRYLNNNITSAIICAGLEPFDSIDDLVRFCKAFREKCNDDIVIYTGYNRHEILPLLCMLPKDNVIVKFGRYKPGYEPHYDEVLGVKLISDNQYAQCLSCEDDIIINTSDEEYFNKIVNALEKNDYYCPCRIDKSNDTRCMCKEFRESDIGINVGRVCHCGLYTKYK